MTEDVRPEPVGMTAPDPAVTVLLADVGHVLGSSLDLRQNVGRLAELVVPFLGTWSIVTVAGEDSGLVDLGTWHRDPSYRDLVAEFATLRLHQLTRESYAHEAMRTGEAVIIADGAHEHIRPLMTPGRARDLLDRLAPRSCAILPMIARGRSVGVLVLYSDEPWRPERRAVADDILGRAALAIDNSLAYRQTRAALDQAERSAERIALLARVNQALSSTADPDEAVGRLARLIVPQQLGDWSFVTIADEDGHLRDIGLAHRDPQREADLAAYSAVHLEEMTDVSAVATGLREGRVVVVPELDDAMLARFLPDPSVAYLTRRLDPFGVAVFPLTARERTFGVLVSVTTSPRGSHTEDEVSTGLEIARSAAPVLETARAAHRARRLAESMQRSFLSVAAPGPGLRAATRYRPAYRDREVGGDWYDVFALPGGATAVTIGDVMGHDLGAISAMAQLRTLMRAAAWTTPSSPAETLAATDRVSAALGPATFATAITADLQPPAADGTVALRWSSAGHPPPIVIDPSGAARVLRVPVVGLPLSVAPGVQRRDHAVSLAPGSVLLLYTDGLIERRDRDIDAGLDELVSAVRTLGGVDLDALLDGLLEHFAVAGSFADDVAMVALQVLGG